jgi:hypothetical protein
VGPLYRVVRVNTPAHTTRPSAFADMRTIIKAGYYWKKSQPVPIPVGTLLVAMGSHGGAGMFLLGSAPASGSATATRSTTGCASRPSGSR